MTEDSEDNLLSVIPLSSLVFRDRDGTSRIFDPSAYNLVNFHQEMVDVDLLYRTVNRQAWLLLRVHRLGKIVSFATNRPVVPTGQFISEHQAVNWLLDRQKSVPEDIDISDRMGVPGGFLPTAEPSYDLMTIDELYLVTLIKPKTLRNKKVLGKPAEEGGGRGKKARWHYLTVKPAIEAAFGKKIPNLDSALAILAAKSEVSSGDS